MKQKPKFYSHSDTYIDNNGYFVKFSNYYEAIFYKYLPPQLIAHTIPSHDIIMTSETGYKQNSHIIKLTHIVFNDFIDLKLGFLSTNPENKQKLLSHVQKCQKSTSQQLGFRLQLANYNGIFYDSKYGYTLDCRQLFQFIKNFLDTNIQQFKDILQSMIKSLQCTNIELFGSGLLIYYDEMRMIQAKLIDFANSKLEMKFLDQMVRILMILMEGL